MPHDPVSCEYELGSPIVRSARLGRLHIVAKDYAPGRWRVKRATLNGRELSNWRIRHDEIVRGGELVFEMSDDY